MASVHLCQYTTTEWHNGTKKSASSRDMLEYDTCEEYTRRFWAETMKTVAHVINRQLGTYPLVDIIITYLLLITDLYGFTLHLFSDLDKVYAGKELIVLTEIISLIFLVLPFILIHSWAITRGGADRWDSLT